LLAIPWVTLVVTPLSMLGVVFGGFWQAGAWGVDAMGVVLGWLAAWPLATLSLPIPPVWVAVAAVLGGALLAKRLPWGLRLLGVPLMLPALLWQSPRPLTGQVEMIAADVAQGTAVLVRTATHSLLYDAGPRWGPESDAGHRVLLPLLRRLDEKLDTLVLSHRDTDHTGGALAVMGMQPQAKLLSSIEADHSLQVQGAAQRCEAGQRWTWDGVLFEVLHPQAGDYTTSAKSNALSCVLRIQAADQVLLLTGDIEAAQEQQLLAREHGALRADVLLVPHHGSRTSSTDEFLQAASPRFALVQAGYRNRFGHPSPFVVERYQALGIALVDTSHCGAATWRSDQPKRLRCEREAALRYWHHRP
jgi:competence protein ComEC